MGNKSPKEVKEEVASFLKNHGLTYRAAAKLLNYTNAQTLANLFAADSYMPKRTARRFSAVWDMDENYLMTGNGNLLNEVRLPEREIYEKMYQRGLQKDIPDQTVTDDACNELYLNQGFNVLLATLHLAEEFIEMSAKYRLDLQDQWASYIKKCEFPEFPGSEIPSVNGLALPNKGVYSSETVRFAAKIYKLIGKEYLEDHSKKEE